MEFNRVKIEFSFNKLLITDSLQKNYTLATTSTTTTSSMLNFRGSCTYEVFLNFEFYFPSVRVVIPTSSMFSTNRATG